MSSTIICDIAIVGSGPVGCTFARKLLEAEDKYDIVMLEAGSKESDPPGSHLRNAFRYQRDINSFINVIRGHLHTLSVPTKEYIYPDTIDQEAELKNGTMYLNQNPEQRREDNLSGAAATYCVGGMGTHWGCATPRLRKDERFPDLIPDDEMDKLYDKAEEYFRTKSNPYVNTMLQTTVQEQLKNYYKNVEIDALPLAVDYEKPYNFWTGPYDILGENNYKKDNFRLMDSHLVKKLYYFNDNGKNNIVKVAEARNLLDNKNEPVHIYANIFIVCCGAILTPQLLYNSVKTPPFLPPFPPPVPPPPNTDPFPFPFPNPNSGHPPRHPGPFPDPRPLPFPLPALSSSDQSDFPCLGKYLCEQSVAFCQVVLKKGIVDNMLNDERWINEVNEHKSKYPKDPIPIPFDTPIPQCWIPYGGKDRPWHCQLGRAAFSYGDTPLDIDNRVILDFRYFGKTRCNKENCVTFSNQCTDMYGMPQPTFHVKASEQDSICNHNMMTEMTNAALSMGGFLPGGGPQFMSPGLALHITGTVRMGANKDDSVVDKNLCVHGFSNLFLGSNGVIPTAITANPTLTSAALAIKSANYIIEGLKKGELTSS